MMTQDEELRRLYQETSAARLQKLQMGLLQLEQDPHSQVVLKDLRQELDGLKDDADRMGLQTIVTVLQELEIVVNALEQQQVHFTLDLSDCLCQGIYAIDQLVHGAVAGSSDDSDVAQTLDSLKAAITTVMSSSAADGVTEKVIVQVSNLYIKDDELREIYRTTSEDRLQSLGQGLYQLENGSADSDLLELLRRETHSLKGDSRAVELNAVADLIQPMEDVIKQLQNQVVPLTEEIGCYLQMGLDLASQLVYSATSGEPCGIDIDQALEQVALNAEVLLVALGAQGLVESTDETTPLVEPADMADELGTATLADAAIEIPAIAASTIADAELREVYRITSTERLQRLEANLLHLEQHAKDEAALSTVLREVHSLKGDARSAGVDTVEALAHALEDILSSLQLQTMDLDSTVSDQLYAGLDAIGTFINEAVTGNPANIDSEQLLENLRKAIPAAPDVADAPLTISPILPVPDEVPSPTFETSKDRGAPTDTIRIQTRDLDVLTTQAEELAVTRIQISQTLSQTEQLFSLWEEWRENKDKPQPVSVLSYEERLENLILTLKSTVESNNSKLELISEDLREQVRRLQLLPISSLFQPIRRMVRDLAREQSKDVALVIEGEETTAEKRILEGIKDSLLHLVRNAIDHGVETPEERLAVGKPAGAHLRIKIYQTAVSLTIEIGDDGRGLDTEKIKQTAIKRKLHSPEELEAMTTRQIHSLILAPGFSTRSFITEISGRGVGLDVVRAQVEALKGAIQIESTQGQGCTFRLQISTALSTANVVLAESKGMTFAIPIEFLETTLLISPRQIVTQDEQDTIMLGDQTIPVSNLVDTLELPNSPIYSWVADSSSQSQGARPCVVLKVGNNQAGFLVDRLLNNQEIVVKPMGALLKRVRNVSGTTVLGTGEICMILNPSDLLKSSQQQPIAVSSPTVESASQHKPSILLVEDSPPVRIQEKRLFEGAGYAVVTATNGLEGYDMLQTGEFDAVVSDVEMPYLDGFSLVRKIRQQREYDELPIILVTTLDSTADRQRGAEAGADAYILKGRFNQEVLLDTLKRLI
ncbi:MAG: hybrid sensor histidine kinase/response regulator [Cyanobacteria bacterium P01_D01_bin.156]